MIKRTCNGCRASSEINNKFICVLGYPIKQVYSDWKELLFPISAKPLAECPKPKTMKQFVKLY